MRDEIANIPPPTTRISDGIRWGPKGALRAGMGTHREKSLLLRDLLKQVGIEATVVEGTLPKGFERARLGLRRPPPPFDPDVGLETIWRWAAAVGVKTVRREAQPHNKPELDALTDSLLESLPEVMAPPPVRWDRALQQLSLVHFKEGESDAWLNPNLVDATWGDHELRYKPRPVRADQLEMPKVEIEVSVMGDDSPYTPRPVLDTTWSLEDLIGRQVRLGFAVSGTPRGLAELQVRDVESFVPVVEVRGPDLSDEEGARLRATGDALTTRGRVVTKAEADRAMTQAPAAPTDPSGVTRLEVQDVQTAEYPRVRLRAWPRGTDGRAVPGLDASAFRLTEEGGSRRLRVLENGTRPPRVFVAFDASGSMPVPYQKREETKVLVKRILAAAREVHPDAELNVAGLGTPLTLLHRPSGWLADEDALLAHVERHYSRQSNSWSALLGAVATDADVAVLISDATTSESHDPYWDARLREGCPAVVLAVREKRPEKTPVLDAMSKQAKGAWYWADTDRERAIAHIQSFLPRTAAERPYLLEFESEPDDKPEHQGVLGIADREVEAPFSFAVPAKEARKPAGRDRLTGILLKVSIGRVSATRVIAGVPPGARHSSHPLTPEIERDVHGALFGSYALSFEGGPPTTSALLDSQLAMRLSARPVLDALAAGDLDAAFAALATPRVTRVPPAYALLHAAIPGAVESGTFPEGHGVVLHSARPGAAGRFELEADILPFFQLQTLGDDRRAARRRTLRVSLEMAAREAAAFERSTLSDADPAPYDAVGLASGGGINLRIGEGPDRARWWGRGVRKHRVGSNALALVPKSHNGRGWWWLDKSTGTALGMLARGAGGGVEETEAAFDDAARIIDLYEFVFGKLGFSLGVWAKLEKTKLEHLKLATIAIIKMDGSIGIEDFEELAENQIRDAVADQIQGQIDDRMGELLPAYGAWNDASGWAEAAENAFRLGSGR